VDLKTERLTVSRLCQSIDIIIGTAMWQHSDKMWDSGRDGGEY